MRSSTALDDRRLDALNLATREERVRSRLADGVVLDEIRNSGPIIVVFKKGAANVGAVSHCLPGHRGPRVRDVLRLCPTSSWTGHRACPRRNACSHNAASREGEE